MKKILICGAGGIGSFLVREINRLTLNNQIDLSEVYFNLVDFDKVELKNISYQNFQSKDIGQFKSQVLAERYLIDFTTEKIESEQDLVGYDIVISCVDNSKARKLIYEYCFKNNTYFIDLRSEGRAIAIFTKEKGSNAEHLIKSLGTDESSKSCQLKYELDNGIIQQGNLIIACIGSQLLLNHLRGEQNQREYRYYI